MDRIPACERTRERLKALMEGHGEKADLRSELVRLAARLIVEEGLEGEAADALGREYYVRGAAPGAGYRNGYRTGRLKTAEGMIEYAAPQISDRAVPFRSRLHEIICGPERGTGCARTVYARYRCAVCRRARPIAVEPHGGERDHAATVGGIRGVCQPRSVRVRGDLPVRRRPRRAAASGATARGGASGLGRTGGG